MVEFYSWFVLLSSEKNEPFGLLFFINPSVTSCHLPYILRCITQGRRVRVTLRSLQCDTPAYGARQGRSLEVALYSFAMNKRSGLYFSNSTPSPCGHSPYIPLRKHRGRGGLTLLLPILVFLTPLLVATLLSSPLCFRKKI